MRPCELVVLYLFDLGLRATAPNAGEEDLIIWEVETIPFVWCFLAFGVWGVWGWDWVVRCVWGVGLG